MMAGWINLQLVFFCVALTSCFIGAAEEDHKCKDNTFPADCECYYSGNSPTADLVSVRCTNKAQHPTTGDDSSFLTSLQEKLKENYNTFADSLEEIVIREYKIPILKRNLIGEQNYDEMITLDLTGNGIEQIHGQAFHHMFDLERLLLDTNSITITGSAPRMFSSVNGIRVLSMRGGLNPETALTSVQYLRQVFEQSDLKDLEELYLSDNHLVYVHGSTFQNLPELAKLDLSKNAIDNVDGVVSSVCYDYDYSQENYWNMGMKAQQCYLEELNLSHNQIRTVPVSFIQELAKMPTFSKLNLTDNPFICDCDMLPFIKELQQDTYTFIENPNNLKCAGPVDQWMEKNGEVRDITGKPFEGKLLVDESLRKELEGRCGVHEETAHNACEHLDKAYQGCNCVKFDEDVVILNCTGQKMTQLKKLPVEVLNNVEEVIFTGQDLTDFTMDDFLPDHQVEFDFLYTLVLAGNNIKTLVHKDGRGPFAAATDLERLVLDDNSIVFDDSISSLRDDLKDLEYLSLRNALAPGQELQFGSLFKTDSFNNLEFLNLENNRIDKITDGVFKALPELRELRLGDNKLQSVHNLVYLNCSDYFLDRNEVPVDEKFTIADVPCKLKTLSLVNNEIQTIPQDFLDTLQRLEVFRYLDLSGNPFRCDSSIKPLYYALKNKTYLEDFTFLNSEKYQCHWPLVEASGRRITDLEEYEIEAFSGAPSEPQQQKHKVASAIIVILCVTVLVVLLVVVYRNRKHLIRRISKVTGTREYRPVPEQV